jgi:hypothetical protein
VKRLLPFVFLVTACGGATASPARTTTATASPARTTAATATPAAARSVAAGPDFASAGLEAGGSGCTITHAASTFPLGVTIHTVLTMSPHLPTGGKVTVTVEKDGVELDRQTTTMTEPTSCMWGTLPELEIGHYRMTYYISPGEMPPVTGEFDVTP